MGKVTSTGCGRWWTRSSSRWSCSRRMERILMELLWRKSTSSTLSCSECGHLSYWYFSLSLFVPLSLSAYLCLSLSLSFSCSVPLSPSLSLVIIWSYFKKLIKISLFSLYYYETICCAYYPSISFFQTFWQLSTQRLQDEKKKKKKEKKDLKHNYIWLMINFSLKNSRAQATDLLINFNTAITR